jgi:hypothetical protein
VKSARRISDAACSFWPTPTVVQRGYVPDMIVENGRLRIATPLNCPPTSGGQFNLTQATASWTALWLMFRGMGLAFSASPIASSPPARINLSRGKGYSASDLISNPRCWEWMMGWPIGWTAPEVPVMGFAAWLRRSRSALSALPTALPPEGSA